jgi:hypothetical protein
LQTMCHNRVSRGGSRIFCFSSFVLFLREWSIDYGSVSLPLALLSVTPGALSCLIICRLVHMRGVEGAAYGV